MKLVGSHAEVYLCRAPELLVEGRAGTGKSIGILTKIHDTALRYPGSRQLICRATRSACTESVLVTWEQQILGGAHPLVAGASRTNRHSYEYPNGSSVVIGGLDEPTKLFSTEWDRVYVNEATEISLRDWELFGRSLRHGKTPYHQQIADCNPDAPGHWLNQRATVCDDSYRIVTDSASYLRLQRFNRGPQTGVLHRIVTVHQDNPAYFDQSAWTWTAVGAQYFAALMRMTGHWRERMAFGRWVSPEGVVYPEFDSAKHVITPFAIPEEWPIYLGYDPGFDHPCAVLWIAIAPNECLYVMDEIYGGGMRVPRLAELIRARNTGRNMRGYYGDPQEINSERQASESIAAQFRKLKHPIHFSTWPRSTDVDAMVQAVATRLMAGSLKVFSSCTNTINEFQSWKFKRNAKGEPLAGDDKYEDRNNDALDVIKGMVALNLTFDAAGAFIAGKQ